MECFRAEKETVLLAQVSFISAPCVLSLTSAILVHRANPWQSFSSKYNQLNSQHHQKERGALLNLIQIKGFRSICIKFISARITGISHLQKYTNMMSSVFYELTSSACDVLTKGMKLVPLWKHYRKFIFPYAIAPNGVFTLFSFGILQQKTGLIFQHRGLDFSAQSSSGLYNMHLTKARSVKPP